MDATSKRQARREDILDSDSPRPPRLKQPVDSSIAASGRGADAALEVVGSPEATRFAVDLVRPGGVVSAVGVHTESKLAFSLVEVYDKNLTYLAGRCPVRHYMERLAPIVREKKYDLGAIVSHRLKLEDGVRGYELFEKKLGGCTKVVLTTWCLRRLLLVMCTHPLARRALTPNLARSEGDER